MADSTLEDRVALLELEVTEMKNRLDKVDEKQANYGNISAALNQLKDDLREKKILGW